MYSDKTKIVFARLALLIATVFWGSTFVVVSGIRNFFQPNFLLALRFLPAFGIFYLIFFKKFKNFDKEYIKLGCFLGLLMFAGYSLQTIAITTAGGLPGRSSFLVASYCILVPFVNAFVLKAPPDKFNLAAAFLCLIGILIISLPELLAENSSGINWGDIFSLASSFVFALYIVFLAKFVHGKDSVLITAAQFLFSGLFALIFSLLFEDNSGTVWNKQSIFACAYLTIICTALCVLLQVIGQKHTHPSTAALIFSLESVFSIIFSIIFTDEPFTLLLGIGFLCIFFAILVSETKLSFLKRKRKEEKK